MKISELDLKTVKDFCGVSDDDSDAVLAAALAAARSFVYGYTGLSETEADGFDDLTAAALVIANEIFTTREFVLENGKINPFAEQVMSMHRVNLL